MDTVTSSKNPLLKSVRKAVLRGTLTDEGLCVAEGFHLLEEALRSDCEITTVFAAPGVRSAVETHVRGLKQIRVVALSDETFAALSATEATQGVLALVRPPAWTLDQLFRGHSLVTVLDGVQDPGNAGTILRSSEAFGGTGVVFLKGSVNPYNPKCLRASAGSVFRVPLVTGIEERLLLASIDQRKLDMFALLPSGVLDVSECHFERKCVIIVGSEGHGVSERLRAKAIDTRIPTVAVESLNAALAAGIALYEARKRRMTGESSV
ncbi:MAG TPA: RNA methyltransferase [Bryobacteraceae bacterium]|nr:RNA methyltransferase [Bryobacteraceae bacterium]